MVRIIPTILEQLLIDEECLVLCSACRRKDSQLFARIEQAANTRDFFEENYVAGDKSDF